MKTDKGQFDEVLHRMLEKPPSHERDYGGAEAPLFHGSFKIPIWTAAQKASIVNRG